MRLRQQLITRVIIAAFLVAPLALGACGGRGTNYRFYDPYYGDHHSWNRAELGLYRRWEVETRRPHLDFNRRPVAERQAYFSWRHGR